MKKKGPRSIPDFSTKRARPATAEPSPEDAVPKIQHPPVMPTQAPKPHATSKKSGRRGA
jgi:hypothetical protein